LFQIESDCIIFVEREQNPSLVCTAPSTIDQVAKERVQFWRIQWMLDMRTFGLLATQIAMRVQRNNRSEL
jgi:hypothetical protein